MSGLRESVRSAVSQLLEELAPIPAGAVRPGAEARDIMGGTITALVDFLAASDPPNQTASQLGILMTVNARTVIEARCAELDQIARAGGLQ